MYLYMIISKLDDVIEYLSNVKDDQRIPDKFINLDANTVYDFLVELKSLREEVQKLKKRNTDLKQKFTKKNIERTFKNPYDQIGIFDFK